MDITYGYWVIIELLSSDHGLLSSYSSIATTIELLSSYAYTNGYSNPFVSTMNKYNI